LAVYVYFINDVRLHKHQSVTVSFTQNVILGRLRGTSHLTTFGARFMAPTNLLDCLLH